MTRDRKVVEIAALVKTQSSLYEQLKRAARNYDKIANIKKSEIYYSTKIDTLKSIWKKFEDNHLLIYDNANKDAEEYISSDLYDLVETLYIEYHVKCQEAIKAMQSEESNSDNSIAVTTQILREERENCRLHPISIPKFDGNYKNWRTFHDIFSTMVHQKASLSCVQKLHYLKTCVTGEAEKLLRPFSIISSNYSKAWEFLQNRYNNKRVLVNTYLKTLFGQQTIRHESANSIKNLIDQTEEVLHELTSLELPTEHWDTILVHVLVQKLPIETHALWEQQQGNHTDLPTYKQLKEFLEARFRTLEAIQENQKQKTNLQAPSLIKNSNNFLNAQTKCIKCKQNHFIFKCPYFRKMTVSQRLEFINKNNLCKNCFSNTHKLDHCTSKKYCQTCNKKHNTLLHENTKPENPTNLSTSQCTNLTAKTSSQKIALLATALINVLDKDKNPIKLRALIDSGSQTSFITKNAHKKLKLPSSNTNTEVSGLGKTQTAKIQYKTNIHIQSLQTNFKTTVETLIIKQITGKTPTVKLNIENYQHLLNLKLADKDFFEPGPIDILLGANIYAEIIKSKVIKGNKNTPTAQATHLGWILFGSTIPETKTTSLFIQEKLQFDLQKFWETEDIPQKKQLSKEDQQCEDIYKATIKRNKDGRYEVELPFKDMEGPKLGESKYKAVSQLYSLEKKFKKDPEYHELYKQCINEYISMGHMKEVHEPVGNKNEVNHYYLPHHAVLKESTTTKLRVVFNASSKTSNGKSLNEQMLIGPTIQPTLWTTLMRWRQFKYVLTADIEKMYRMINIASKHHDYQRIVWRENPEEKIKDYALTTVTFGTTPAPFLAIRTLHQLAKDEAENFPKASRALLESFYVDDCCLGANTIEEAKTLQIEMLEMLKTAGFHLRKWTSNNEKLLEDIPTTDIEMKPALELSTPESIKTLGLHWYPKDDIFSFKVKLKTNKNEYTKRKILSEVASLFDPFGWLSPCIVTAKILIQKLWMSGCTWDEKINNTISEEWSQFRSQLKHIENIKIPRYTNHTPNKQTELHGFCDASTKAYAAVIYLVTQTETQKHVSLIAAKTKVAPIKPLTLPRLELCAAVLLSRLMKQIQEDMSLKNIPQFAWSDSEIALAWIKGSPERWKTYIANRVVEIQDNIPPTNWRYVSSAENPADCASRGIMPELLPTEQLWWKGPEWITLTKDLWPNQPAISTPTIETRKIKVFLNTEEYSILSRYSTFNKLVRIIAYCLRFFNNCRKNTRKLTNYLTTDEIQNAEKRIISLVQQEVFSNEIKNFTAQKPISKKSRIRNLRPFLASDGVLRVGGRLNEASLPYNTKHPIIIPNKHYVTTLLINHFHYLTLHGGTQLVLNTLRNKYWLLNARNTIRLQLHKCVKCFKTKSHPNNQIMGNLPEMRVNISLPFQHVGIDYAGPIDIKTSKIRNAKIIKGYLSIFICMATKAIHIEIVTDLTTEAFLAAFKRFTSRRGLCSDIYSDQGTTFVGANKILNQEFKRHMKNLPENAAKELEKQKVKWHFNPPSAPHFGGLWEAAVKSVKTHLKRTIANSNLTYEELSTLLCQIEACVNSRPLIPLSNDPNDHTLLTPGHFLTGRHLLTHPETKLDENITTLRKWKYIQQLLQQFWYRWQQEYLHTLQQRTKWYDKQTPIKENDIVMIKDERYPPIKWPIGKILALHPGKDNITRVVTVKTSTNTYQRPTTKVIKLPLEPNH